MARQISQPYAPLAYTLKAKDALATTDGMGVEIIVDLIGATYFHGNLDAAARDRKIVHLGAVDGTKLPKGVDVGAFVR
ncbi:MAG: hypothetical protein Q9209_007943 [Squamulea sp. 1 TL-2023]